MAITVTEHQGKIKMGFESKRDITLTIKGAPPTIIPLQGLMDTTDNEVGRMIVFDPNWPHTLFSLAAKGCALLTEMRKGGTTKVHVLDLVNDDPNAEDLPTGYYIYAPSTCHPDNCALARDGECPSFNRHALASQVLKGTGAIIQATL